MPTMQVHHLKVLINSMDLSINCPNLSGRWQILTQDHWVIQTVAGYQLELTAPPHQVRVPHQIRCSPESMAQISTEVPQLLMKGAITETHITPQSFVSQIFLVEKKDGGQLARNKPEVSQSLCENRALQDKRPPSSPRSTSATGLDGEAGLEGCLPSDSNSPRPPDIAVGRQAIHVQMSSIWPVISTKGVHKVTEIYGGLSEANWVPPDNISGQTF